MAQGLFREDLYYRLNGVPLRLPPLRERGEDVPDLFRHFLRGAVRDGLPERSFETAALERLKAHAWPGNVRELENLVRRLVALHPGEIITAAAVERELSSQLAARPAGSDSEEAATLGQLVERHLAALLSGAPPPPGLHGRVIAEVERPLIAACLALTGGNQLRAAEILGVNRNTLRKKIRELGVG
jgi:two-component system nitrogen regulation response regulator GlnG